MAKKQTAGRDALGGLAPKFAELNDDVLFGEVWSREDKLSCAHFLKIAQGAHEQQIVIRKSSIVNVVTTTTPGAIKNAKYAGP